MASEKNSSPESKQEEFMKYLEKSGVVDILTKVLISLYESNDRPTDAISFIKEFLGAPPGVEISALKETITKLSNEIEELKKSKSATDNNLSQPNS